MRNLDGNALLIDGHVPRADAIAAAREHMLAAGMDEITVDDLLVDRPHLIGRAWWGGDDVGFVNEGINGLREADTPSGRGPSDPVTVVHVEVPL